MSNCNRRYSAVRAGTRWLTPREFAPVPPSTRSFSLTTFSPSGKLVQIEHALAAVAQGTTSLGIKGTFNLRLGSRPNRVSGGGGALSSTLRGSEGVRLTPSVRSLTHWRLRSHERYRSRDLEEGAVPAR